MAKPGIQQVRPQTQREFMNKLVKPSDPQYGNPNLVFSEPFKPGQPEFNRAYETSYRDDPEPKKFSIGLKDLDEAVQYYFENVLQLRVYQNNDTILVPVVYGLPEKWVSVQQDGYYRDVNQKIMSPLIMYKRASITQNRTLGNKVDGNNAHNVQLFEKSYTRGNAYDNFHVLQNQKLQKEFAVIVTPDYITVEYDVILWTNYVEQMNKLIEALNFASNSYWGDPNAFKFLTKMESFTDAQSYVYGEDRVVKTNFTMTLNGYLIPDSVNAQLAQLQNKTYNLCKIIFSTEQAV